LAPIRTQQNVMAVDEGGGPAANVRPTATRLWATVVQLDGPRPPTGAVADDISKVR